MNGEQQKPEALSMDGVTYLRADLVESVDDKPDELTPGKGTTEFKFFAAAFVVALAFIAIGTWQVTSAGSDGAGLEDGRMLVGYGVDLVKWVVVGYGATRGLPKFGQQLAGGLKAKGTTEGGGV